MAFTLPSLKSALKKTSNDTGPYNIQGKFDMPEFKFNELANKEVIGHGSYGIVYKTSYLGKTVVVKNILGESAAEQNSFVKEARLIKSLQHKNVVAFIGFCSEPYAMMLEYVYFDFLPFEISKKVSNLVDFLNFADKIDAFESLNAEKIQINICRDISEGLEYLHHNEVAHRDLKGKNILVSNQHYCHESNMEERWATYEKVPIICKLADFGESRSVQIQTAELHSTTKRVDR